MENITPLACAKPGCTLSQTGKCITEHDPLTCPDRLSLMESIAMPMKEVSGDSVLSSPDEIETFGTSLSLASEAVNKILSSKNCKVVAILGIPGTGKTASLVSLYLLLAKNKLTGFKFRDSKSIMAFEEISRGARRWNTSNLPEHLTVHTELQDERTAGFLHLRLERIEDGKLSDFLFTDLPGEWTSSLIDNNRTDRLKFLHASDRIIVTLNAEFLVNHSTRSYAIHRIKLLIQRIEAYLQQSMTSVNIVLTHCDRTGTVKEHLADLIGEFRNFELKVFEIASFSDTEAIVAGAGISELISDLIVGEKKSTTHFWPIKQNGVDRRSILNYGLYK